VSRVAVATGVKRGGKIEWDDQRGFTDDLQFMKDGSVVVRVTLATPHAIRSVKLNRYYRGHVLRLMAEHTGDDPDVLHLQMCAMFLTRTTQLIDKRTGEVRDVQIVGRTSKLDSEDFWEFILKVRLFAAEFMQVETHDPDPAWKRNQTEAA
jgi:hypothetical protein